MARHVIYDWWSPNGDNWLHGGDVNTNYEIYGYGGNDTLAGNDGADSLLGGDGDDVLFGGDFPFMDGPGSADTLKGGDGNDTFYIDRGDNLFVGGGGIDTLSFKFAYASLFTPFDLRVLEPNYGYLFDAESGTTAHLQAGFNGFAPGAGQITDAGDMNTLSEGIDVIDMTLNDDILRDSNSARRLQGRDGNDIIEGRGGADTIDGGNGIDVASYDSSPFGVSVDLTASSQLGGDANGDVLIDIENLTGSAHSDFLGGNSAGNRLSGGDGDDILAGKGGKDILTGGDGEDWFRYASASDSGTTTATRDIIMDFEAGIDNLDFSAMVSRSGFKALKTVGNDDLPFDFIGSSGFSGRGGELRAVEMPAANATHYLVSGDRDGDRVADFSIEVHMAELGQQLRATDFFL